LTSYAVDIERRSLVAVWGTGSGDVAATVAELPQDLQLELALQLADSLTSLSKVLWRVYTQPSTTADDLEESEDSRRDDEREAFDAVSAALVAPNLPANGTLIHAYVRVEEAAHRAGRALHAIGDPGLTAAVATDVDAELQAVERAELGDFTERGRQAVLLDRADASPAQVAAADALFKQNPFGSQTLFTDFDPTAAAVAAAHWLVAAADVVADRTEIDPSDVVAEADNLAAMPVEASTLVLRRVGDGETVRDVVVSLVRDAMLSAAGELPDIRALLARVAEVEARAARAGDRADEIREVLMPRRTTPLDPARPARDLLEDLLVGIRGCWLLWLEDGEEDYSDEPNAEANDLLDEDSDLRAEDDRLTQTFLEAVRARAALDADRLDGRYANGSGD
jgi:hypothetical protein